MLLWCWLYAGLQAPAEKLYYKISMSCCLGAGNGSAGIQQWSMALPSLLHPKWPSVVDLNVLVRVVQTRQVMGVHA